MDGHEYGRVRCQCELDHDKVGTHPAFHPDACRNYGTEVLTSDYGTFTLCPPCADDALGGGFYRRQAMNLVRDTNLGAHNVSVPCLVCGRMLLLSDALIDRDGPAFRAYYHPACLPKEEN
jgi:hypothetical protein